PVQMQIFGAWLAVNIQWLTSSPDGNRVAAFAGLVLAVVGIYAFIRAIIIKSYGSAAFGWGQVSIGIILVCVAGYGWHLSQIHLLPAIGMAVVGFIIISKGSDNITNDEGAPQSPPPQFPEQIPMHDTHSARWASADEMGSAWGGKQSNSNEDEGTVWD
ncbi:MAG: hypothetical protein P4L90_29330, partial [Rhodopila sp.]|nr:hypothetical protein [Rhodopila sp.]